MGQILTNFKDIAIGFGKKAIYGLLRGREKYFLGFGDFRNWRW